MRTGRISSAVACAQGRHNRIGKALIVQWRGGGGASGDATATMDATAPAVIAVSPAQNSAPLCVRCFVFGIKDSDCAVLVFPRDTTRQLCVRLGVHMAVEQRRQVGLRLKDGHPSNALRDKWEQTRIWANGMCNSVYAVPWPHAEKPETSFWGWPGPKNPELKELYRRHQGSLDAINYCLLNEQRFSILQPAYKGAREGGVHVQRGGRGVYCRAYPSKTSSQHPAAVSLERVEKREGAARPPSRPLAVHGPRG